MESNKRDHKPSDKPIECEGCTSSTGLAILCRLRPKYNDKECPCCKCVIKVMCSTLCVEFSKYIWTR
jgi:hypothetical protein